MDDFRCLAVSSIIVASWDALFSHELIGAVFLMFYRTTYDAFLKQSLKFGFEESV